MSSKSSIEYTAATRFIDREKRRFQVLVDSRLGELAVAFPPNCDTLDASRHGSQ
jgi:hypothetical protein